MTRPTESRRLALTIDLNEYERLSAYARETGRPLATAARRLLISAVDAQSADDAAASLGRACERVQQLEAEITQLRSQLAQRDAIADLEASLPRWRWPIETLLADREWWDEWLPQLGELLGRHLQHDHEYGAAKPEHVVDERGYADLMRYLFPPLADKGKATIEWYSPSYPICARREATTTHASRGRQRPVRAEVWESVIRQVARALTALETTSQHPEDAYTHLRVQAEIRGEWTHTLGAMIGEGSVSRPNHLPSVPLP